VNDYMTGTKPLSLIQHTGLPEVDTSVCDDYMN